jgi:hypothetical protein
MIKADNVTPAIIPVQKSPALTGAAIKAMDKATVGINSFILEWLTDYADWHTGLALVRTNHEVADVGSHTVHDTITGGLHDFHVLHGFRTFVTL